MNNKYVLTYDLKILYSPDIDLSNTCKELDLKTLQFRLYDGEKDSLKNGYELDPNEVNTIASNILMGKIGYELPLKKMEWLEKFEKLLKENMKLILEKKLAYTYFILKLQLIGFSEEVAKDFVTSYYESLNYEQNVAHPQVLLKNINKFLKEKMLWIPNNLDRETDLEYHFLEKVIYSKQEKMYKFSFDQMYQEEYLLLCKNGLVEKIFQYNMYPSYLVRKKYKIIDLIPYVFSEYEKIIKTLMSEIYTNNYLNINEGFIYDTIKHMETSLRLYITLALKD